MYISIGQAAAVIGVSISTIRRWEREEKFLPNYRTLGGHRRYNLADLEKKFLKSSHVNSSQKQRKTIIYARVSSSGQRADLERQIDSLKKYCKKNKFPFSLISDLGSGINYNKRGLNHLIDEICKNQVARLVLTHRDRLLRFGSPLLFKLCDFHGTEVIILNDKKIRNFEEELVQDVLEIMTVFCSKIYGRRAHENRFLSQQAA